MATVRGTRVDSENFITTITWGPVTTADVTDSAEVADLVERTIHVVGAGTAQLRGSNNNSNFVNIGSALAANSLTQMTINSKYIDFNPIATATITIVLVGKRV